MTSALIHERIAKIRERLAADQVDAFMITSAPNIQYMSGFSPSAPGDGTLLITGDRALVITDFRYYEQAERQAPDYTLYKLEKSFPAAFAELVHEIGVHRVAFESAHVTCALHQELAATEGLELVPFRDWVEDLRVIKTPEEIDLIRRAVAISDAAIGALPEFLRPGMTEKQLAWELEAFMRTHGADEVSFSVIAAAGPNGAMAHAIPSDRPIVPGEPIVLDLGARVAGYCSDLTRTICLGEPGDELRRIYGIVLAAQETAEASIRPGMTGKEADAIARQVIADAGYGSNFGHGLGHGVGLEIHERPSVGPRSQERLEPGMVFSIEPGIYLQGWGGVRIEDLAVVTEEGVDVLTRATKGPVLRR